MEKIPFRRKIPGYRSGTKWKMVVASLLYFFVFCGIMGTLFGEEAPEQAEKPPAVEPASNKQQPLAETTQAELAQIEITIDAQDMFNADKQPKQKVVVWAKNTSDKVFKGTIAVTSMDVDGKSLGRDYIYIEGLEPGKNTYAILWLKTSPYSPSFKTSISGEFK